MKHEIDLKDYSIRTDLITEIIEDKEENGINKKVVMEGDIRVTEVYLNKEGAKSLNKKEGNYITIEFEDVTDKDNYKKVEKVFVKYLKKILKKNNFKENDSVLIIGLGNEKSTPDALGPLTLNHVLVTRHLFLINKQGEDYRCTSIFKPGVTGNNGIETSDMILKITEAVKPNMIIVIDALASFSIERVCTTIQMTDTGIHPGSGVGNDRKEISKESFGIPVIAIGVPTVVDAATITHNTIGYMYKYFSYAKEESTKSSSKLKVGNVNYLKKNIKINDEDKKSLFGILGNLEEDEVKKFLYEVLNPIGYNFMVTPKEIDFVLNKLSTILGEGMNKVFHKNYKNIL